MQVATREDGLTTRDPAYQGYQLLRAGFVVAPILFGLDKFFNWMVEWPDYLAPWLDRLIPGTAQEFMYAVGAIEDRSPDSWCWSRRDGGA